MAPQNRSKRIKACMWVAAKLDGALAKAFTEIIVFVAIPAIVTEIFNSQAGTSKISAWLQLDKGTTDYLANAQVFVFAAFWVWIFALRWLINLIQSVAKQGDALTPRHLVALHNLIDGPVEGKSDRFAKMAKEIFQRRQTGKVAIKKGEAFQQITKPEDQIFLIAKALLESFRLLTKEHSKLKLRVAACRNGQLESWFTWQPYGSQPSTDIAELNDSTMTLCAKRKSLIIIEDISAELKLGSKSRFKRTATGDNTSGSLLCYAITHAPTNDVPYVISVHSNFRNEFLESQREVYEWIFEKFAVRFVLEHSLRYVKENTI